MSRTINRTVHAAALSALVETTNSYYFYFVAYGRSTPCYIAQSIGENAGAVERPIKGRNTAPGERI
jgi:hypothetical protein